MRERRPGPKDALYGRTLTGDREIPELSLEVFPLNIDRIHPGDGRSFTAPVQHGIDLRSGAFEYGFNPPVGQIAYHP